MTLWNQLIAPKGWAGSVLLSPSMCKQAAEHGWLQPFQSKISKDWDITNIHVNKNSAAGIYADIVSLANSLARASLTRSCRTITGTRTASRSG